MDRIFLKKGNLSSESICLTVFCRIIECDKRQGTLYKAPKGLLAITVEAKKINSIGPKIF